MVGHLKECLEEAKIMLRGIAVLLFGGQGTIVHRHPHLGIHLIKINLLSTGSVLPRYMYNNSVISHYG
jgi:hypothetical protein